MQLPKGIGIFHVLGSKSCRQTHYSDRKNIEPGTQYHGSSRGDFFFQNYVIDCPNRKKHSLKTRFVTCTAIHLFRFVYESTVSTRLFFWCIQVILTPEPLLGRFYLDFADFAISKESSIYLDQSIKEFEELSQQVQTTTSTMGRGLAAFVARGIFPPQQFARVTLP